MTTYPRVYIEERTSGVHPITGVPTGVTAFIGAAQRGRSNHPQRVRSFADFGRVFGGPSANLELGYAVQQFFLNGGSDAWIIRVNRQLRAPQLIRAIHALSQSGDFDLLALPGISTSVVLTAATDFCAEHRAFFLIDPPPDVGTAAGIEQWVRSGAVPRSSNSALYFPWIEVATDGQLRSSAPSGSVAGMIARTDMSRGVWKAPAGTEAVLRGARSLKTPFSDDEMGRLNATGINCLRKVQEGVVVWGARTLLGSNEAASEWKYVPVRRMALYLERSIERGLQWVVFEPNDEPLWAKIRLNVGAFLQQLFRSGAFQGSTPRDAYFVKCDQETTARPELAAGIVRVLVGFAPVKPGEFVVLNIACNAQPRSG